MVSSHKFSFILVVIQGSLVKERAEAAFQVLTLCDLQVQYKEGLEGHADLLPSLDMELSTHHASEDISNHALLSETAGRVVKSLLLAASSHLTPGSFALLVIIGTIAVKESHLLVKLVE